MGRWNEKLLGKRPLLLCRLKRERALIRDYSGLTELVASVDSMAPRFLGWLRSFLVRCIGSFRLLSMIRLMLQNSGPKNLAGLRIQSPSAQEEMCSTNPMSLYHFSNKYLSQMTTSFLYKSSVVYSGISSAFSLVVKHFAGPLICLAQIETSLTFTL